MAEMLGWNNPPNFVFWTPMTHEHFLKFHHLSKSCFLVFFHIACYSCSLCLVLTFAPLYVSPSIISFSEIKKPHKSATKARWSFLVKAPNFHKSQFLIWEGFIFYKMKGFIGSLWFITNPSYTWSWAISLGYKGRKDKSKPPGPQYNHFYPHFSLFQVPALLSWIFLNPYISINLITLFLVSPVRKQRNQHLLFLRLPVC